MAAEKTIYGSAIETCERELVGAIAKRDDVLQRLEDEGIREVNDLRQTTEAIWRQNEDHGLRVVAIMAEQPERLALMDPKNAEADTALLDLQEKHQIALIEYEAFTKALKEHKETEAAIAATLAFAMVRSEGNAAVLDQNQDDASAESDHEWSSEDKETVELIPDDNKKKLSGAFVH